MTNNHVLSKEDITKGRTINIKIKNENYNIIIDDLRKVYTDENYDITIIEMKKNDGLNFNTFLEIDYSIYNENPYEYFKCLDIYLLHYPEGNPKPKFSIGKIKKIMVDHQFFEHTCNTEHGSSGGPILICETNKVVGIHKGAKIKYNLGIFIKKPIEEFYKKYIINNQIEDNKIQNIDDNKDKEGENDEKNNNQNVFDLKKNQLKENKENYKNEELIQNKIKYPNKNDIKNYENEFSLFNNDNNINNNDILAEENIPKEKENNNEMNNNQIKKNNNNEMNSNQIKNNNNEINSNQLKNNNNNNEINSNQSKNNNFIWDNKINQINHNVNNNSSFNISFNNNFKEKEEIEYNIDEIMIKYKKNNSNLFIESLYKFQEYNIKEDLSDDKLFGETFVKNNKHLCKIIIGNRVYELKSYLNQENEEVKNEEFKIKLKGVSKIKDLSYMFSGCLSLDSIEGFEKLNTKNIISFSHLFSFCKVSSIPDISNWDTSNVRYMDNMFLHCINLKSIPNISKWNTSKLMNISYLFADCRCLLYLPDISKWNINNLEFIEGLFFRCYSLQILPDISKWKTDKIKSFKMLFSHCSKLVNLPDISIWDTKNVIDMSSMFDNCVSLETLPEISKWNTNKVRNMNKIFNNCESLAFLPDISKWITFNVKDMAYMFYNCKNLIELPDISKWNISNVKDKAYMFDGCQKNLNVPNKFKTTGFQKFVDFWKNPVY